MRARRFLPVSALLPVLVAGALTPAGAAAPTPANRRSGPPATRFVTENVKSNPTMPQPHVLHDVREGASLGDVVLWQEIAPDRYTAAVAGLPSHWRTVQTGTEDPISFDTRVWRLVSTDRALLSRGRAHVTPRRWATWALLQHVGTGRVVVFMDTHYVSGAWVDRPVTHRAWRRRLWLREWARQDDVVDGLTQRGLTVLGGGDFNRVRLPRFAERQMHLNSGSIDHLWVVPGARGDVDPGSSWRDRHLYSDHDAVVGSFSVGSGVR
jgi:hypothetical protein